MNKKTVLSCLDTCPGCNHKREIKIEVDPKKEFRRVVKYTCIMCGCNRVVVFDSNTQTS